MEGHRGIDAGDKIVKERDPGHVTENGNSADDPDDQAEDLKPGRRAFRVHHGQDPGQSDQQKVHDRGKGRHAGDDGLDTAGCFPDEQFFHSGPDLEQRGKE